MSGIGAGAGATASASVTASAEAWRKIMASAIGQSSAELRENIKDMIEAEIMEEDHGPMECTRCGKTFAMEVSVCPGCDTVPEDKGGHPENQVDMGIENEEIPVSLETEEEYEDEPITVDLSNRIEDVLYELGFDNDEAIRCGLILAGIYEQNKSVDEELYKQCINEYESINETSKSKLTDNKVMSRILSEFETIAAEEEERKRSPVQCDIYIEKDPQDRWIVRVDDPLKNVVSGASGKIQVTDYHKISCSMIVSIRRKAFMKLGYILIKRHIKYFKAESPEDAEKTLVSCRLVQKRIAEEVEVHPSTISRWCSSDSVWVFTPYGAFPLGDFFKTGTRRKDDVTKEGICDMIKIAKKLYKENKNKEKNKEKQGDFILRYLESDAKTRGAEFKMSKRSLSDYLKNCSK